MKDRVVKLIYPSKKKSKISLSISRIPFSKNMTIYDTVDVFKKAIFSKPSKIKVSIKQVTTPILLRDIVNLHNVDGIRDFSQIKTMLQKIKSGKDIFSPEGLPNVKLVKTRDKKFVLFDGHHSMLAYMLSGKKYLDEIPHLVVENERNRCVTDEEISVFFGKEHASELRNKNWRDYVINWQVPKEKQLQFRRQKNMGELLIFYLLVISSKDNLAIK